ncbi:MAG: hypothetical protein R3C61_22165 [Bacteroidia bacterium]
MKYATYFTGLLLAVSIMHTACAQPDLSEINARRIQTTRNTMWVLGGWATANIASGLVLRPQAEAHLRYFHEMNIWWNVINLGLATGGFIGTLRQQPGDFDEWQTFREQQKTEQILLFNAGLDLAYITTGIFLTEKAKNTPSDQLRLKGYGQSLMLQGGFLFLYDLSAFIIHKKQNQAGYRLMIAPGAQQIGLRLSF